MQGGNANRRAAPRRRDTAEDFETNREVCSLLAQVAMQHACILHLDVTFVLRYCIGSQWAGS